MAREQLRKRNADFLEAVVTASHARDAGREIQQSVQRAATQFSASFQSAVADVGQGFSRQVRKRNADFLEAVAAASHARDAGWEIQQSVQRSAAQFSASLQSALADVGQDFSRVTEQYLSVVGRIGLEHQFGQFLPKFELPDFPSILEPLLSQLRLEESLDESGWLLHRSTPVVQVRACVRDGHAIQPFLCNYYGEHWTDVRHAIESWLTTCALDDEAKATFREALAAHEAGFYRSVCRLLFPEIERVVRKNLHGDSLKKDLSGQRQLRKLARNLPVSIAGRAGFFGLHLCRRLSNHLYESVRDDDARRRFSGDPVPNRHAVVHGVVEYSSMQNSLNAIFMTEFLFSTIVWLRDARKVPVVDP